MRSWILYCEFISITKMRKREQHGNPNWLIELIDCVKKETLCWITNSRLELLTSIEFDGCTTAGVERHNGTETKSNQNDEFSFNSIRRKTAVRYQFYYENRSCILPVFSMCCIVFESLHLLLFALHVATLTSCRTNVQCISCGIFWGKMIVASTDMVWQLHYRRHHISVSLIETELAVVEVAVHSLWRERNFSIQFTARLCSVWVRTATHNAHNFGTSSHHIEFLLLSDQFNSSIPQSFIPLK